MRLILAVLLLLSCFTTNAQNAGEEMKLQEEKLATPAETENLEVIEVLDQEEIVDSEDGGVYVIPSFVGGELALMKFVGSNINYPKKARKKNIEGRVIIKFVVEEDGSISNAKILRDIGGGCGKEALRVINSMPDWNPGMQKGKVVPVECFIPVEFSLT